MRSIKLHKLLDLVGIIPSLDLIDHEINNISFNSKEVQKGTLFLGMPGLNVDGGKFCIEAIKNGAVSEVKKFIKLKVPKVKTASKAIGIAEIREYLKKKIEISEVIQKISIKTRQYAKRQSTWGRGNMMDWNKIKSEDLNKFLKKI